MLNFTMEDEFDMRNVLELLNSKKVKIVLLIVMVLLLIYSVNKIIKHSSCDKANGFFLENGTCHIPKNDFEREMIIKHQGVKDEYSLDEKLQEQFYLLNLS